MDLRSSVRQARRIFRQGIGFPLQAAWFRLRALTPAAPGMVGAWPDYQTALSHVPKGRPGGYDNADVAPVSFERMCQVQNHDYPVLFWLQRHLRPGSRILDIGGHMGTKFIGFSRLIDLTGVEWHVVDLPAIVAAARERQAQGHLPAAIRFHDDAGQAPHADILLASGLFQYLDVPLAGLLARLAARPPMALFNKVATREGASVTTLERIGPAWVPYQMRNRAGFEAEIAAAGYRIADSWDIPALAHVIPTHPALGPSRSLGYFLTDAA
ncbi:MAG: methyltransferase, TIGR04325 family [Paracoccaceae bacterium]